MKRKIYVILLVIAFLLAGAAGAIKVMAQLQEIYYTVTINNEDFQVAGVNPRGVVFLNANELSVASGVEIKPGPGKSLYVRGNLVRNVIINNGKAFINAHVFANVAGYSIAEPGTNHVAFTGTNSQCLPESENLVGLTILSIEKLETSNPNEVMYDIDVEFTNKCGEDIQFTNNNLFMQDEQGKTFPVTRLRFFQTIFLKPGESAKSDRVYFVVETGTKLQRLILRRGGQTLGSTSF